MTRQNTDRPRGGPKPPPLTRTAVLSADDRYRYRLTRRWDPSAPSLVVIGLNPSTADAHTDDPTIRRCMAFAQREGCGALEMVNLFAYRSTRPDRLGTVPDPIGPDNDRHIAAAVAGGGPVVAAWGANRHRRGRDAAVTALVHSLDVNLLCLGRTGGGHPCHPLYLPGDTPLQLFKERPMALLTLTGIGYQGRDLDGFLGDVAALGVRVVVDVRLNPLSRKPGFSRRALEQALGRIGVQYRHEPALGNPQANRAGFAGDATELAQARERFRRLLIEPEAREALDRIVADASRTHVALLCFEDNQQRCHRAVLLDELAADHGGGPPSA